MQLVMKEHNMHADSSIRYAFNNMQCQSPVLAFRITDPQNNPVGDLVPNGLLCTLQYEINTLEASESSTYQSLWRSEQVGNGTNGLDTTRNAYLAPGEYNFIMDFTVTAEDPASFIKFSDRTSRNVRLKINFEVVK